jgi:hypothetical protein
LPKVSYKVYPISTFFIFFILLYSLLLISPFVFILINIIYKFLYKILYKYIYTLYSQKYINSLNKSLYIVNNFVVNLKLQKLYNSKQKYNSICFFNFDNYSFTYKSFIINNININIISKDNIKYLKYEIIRDKVNLIRKFFVMFDYKGLKIKYNLNYDKIFIKIIQNLLNEKYKVRTLFLKSNKYFEHIIYYSFYNLKTNLINYNKSFFLLNNKYIYKINYSIKDFEFHRDIQLLLFKKLLYSLVIFSKKKTKNFKKLGITIWFKIFNSYFFKFEKKKK